MISLKKPEQLETMSRGGALLASFLDQIKQRARIGVTTLELNDIASRLIREVHAEPSFLNFNGYPAVLCTSINEEIVHGLPTERTLVAGDLLKIDLGLKYQGFHVDSALTVIVGEDELEPAAVQKLKELVNVTRNALNVGIAQAYPGHTTGDIGHAIQKYVESGGFSVIRDLIGHGVGYELHEKPEIPNYGRPGTGDKLVEGMTIAIEPMVTFNSTESRNSEDGFSIVTVNGDLAAHFEHTVAITKEGPRILTKMSDE